MANGSPPSFTGGGALPNIGVPYSEVGPTSVPDFSSLLNYLLQTGSQAGQGVPQLQDLLQQGASSPLMQAVLGPALQNLIPGQQLARQNLSDQFIQAGMTGSGAQGVASNQLQQALGQQQNSLISQIMSSMLPTMVSGMNQQYANQFRLPELLAQALGISRPATVTGSQAGLNQSVSGGSSSPSMAQNPFFTPDPFASGGAGGAGGAGGPAAFGSQVAQSGGGQAGAPAYYGSAGTPPTMGAGGPQPGAPQGFQNPALAGFSYGSSPGVGGGAWAPTTPIDWNAYAGTSGSPGGSGIMQDPNTGFYTNDPYNLGISSGGGGTDYLTNYGQGFSQPYDYGMNTNFIGNQGVGFGVSPLQPEDYMMGAFGQQQAPDISSYDFSSW